VRYERVPVSPRCRSSVGREVDRAGEGASRTGARFGRLWGQSHCLSSQVSAQVFIERHDRTRPAHAPWGLTRFMVWELGSRRSDSPYIGASRCTAQEAAVWHSDPNRAVPARMTTDARGRTRPSEAPPAAPQVVGAGGRHRSQKLHRQRTFFAQRSPARCLGRRDRPKRARLTARHLIRDPGARTHGIRMQPPIGQRYCLITSPCEPRKRRRVMRGLVQAPGMARSGSSRR
jgi:hypothetical protein